MQLLNAGSRGGCRIYRKEGEKENEWSYSTFAIFFIKTMIALKS